MIRITVPHVPVDAVLAEPLLALFPHGLQHGSRRNAYQAMGVASADRRERQAVDAEVADLLQAADALQVARG
jgi:hypothetical protein